MAGEKRTVVMLLEAPGGVLRNVIDLYSDLKDQFDVKLILSPVRLEHRYVEELARIDPADLRYVPLKRGPTHRMYLDSGRFGSMYQNSPDPDCYMRIQPKQDCLERHFETGSTA